MLKEIPLTDLLTLSAYICDLSIVANIEPDVAEFEGGDSWIFDQFEITVNQQVYPLADELTWLPELLSMPGRKNSNTHAWSPRVGGRYIAFYSYSAMAKGYALEQLLEWDVELLTELKGQLV